ncbi:MAG: DivIVA domain-containing protein, partial [Acidimicrobiales bacterium]
DAYVAAVAKAAAQLQGRLTELQDRVESAESRLASAGVGETEQTLTRTLVLAQRTADTAVAEAEEQAASILAAAEQKASAMLADADRRANAAVSAAETQAEARLGECDALAAARLHEAEERSSRLMAEVEIDRRRILAEAERTVAATARAERDRLHADVEGLEQTRALLRDDVEILERHLSEQRVHLREALATLRSLVDDSDGLRSSPAPSTSGVEIVPEPLAMSVGPGVVGEPETDIVSEAEAPAPAPAPAPAEAISEQREHEIESVPSVESESRVESVPSVEAESRVESVPWVESVPSVESESRVESVPSVEATAGPVPVAGADAEVAPGPTGAVPARSSRIEIDSELDIEAEFAESPDPIEAVLDADLLRDDADGKDAEATGSGAGTIPSAPAGGGSTVDGSWGDEVIIDLDRAEEPIVATGDDRGDAGSVTDATAGTDPTEPDADVDESRRPEISSALPRFVTAADLESAAPEAERVDHLVPGTDDDDVLDLRTDADRPDHDDGPTTQPVPVIDDPLPLFTDLPDGAAPPAEPSPEGSAPDASDGDDDPFLVQLRAAVASDEVPSDDDVLSAFFDQDDDKDSRSWFGRRR